MRSLAVFCCLLSLVACNLLDDLRELPLDTLLYELREEGADESETADASGKGNLQITASDGKLLNNVTFFEKEKLQVELPADRNVCLIRAIETNATCFNEVAITEPVSKNITELCVGRQLMKLEDAECKEPGTETDREYELTERASRNRCTRYTYTVSCKCKCCRHFLFVCTKRCCRRRVIWTRHSIYGYSHKFRVSA